MWLFLGKHAVCISYGYYRLGSLGIAPEFEIRIRCTVIGRPIPHSLYGIGIADATDGDGSECELPGNGRIKAGIYSVRGGILKLELKGSLSFEMSGGNVLADSIVASGSTRLILGPWVRQNTPN